MPDLPRRPLSVTYCKPVFLACFNYPAKVPRCKKGPPLQKIYKITVYSRLNSEKLAEQTQSIALSTKNISGMHSRASYIKPNIKLLFRFVKKWQETITDQVQDLLLEDKFSLSESESSGDNREGTYAYQGTQIVDLDALAG